ncbi:MAG: hypothetical protein ACR2PX_04260 [Endozoicomonas sp.]|uniref:hypothetical protein n=1 Tax=Endozoicomonas sp. TaxID=1892382 RepID=UPI003D9ABE94
MDATQSDSLTKTLLQPFTEVRPGVVEWRPSNFRCFTYRCNKQLLEQSLFLKKYDVQSYVDSGEYSSIYSGVDKKDKTQWAIKVVDKSGGLGLLQFPYDVQNLQLAEGCPEVIQLREVFDFGGTGVLITQWADADLKHRNGLIRNIKDDRSFRVLAKQMLEAVAALDQLGLDHSEARAVDFLYVQRDGRIKISALERADQNHKVNVRLLVTVFNALEAISMNISLEEESQLLLQAIKQAKMPDDEEAALMVNDVSHWLRKPEISAISGFSEKMKAAEKAFMKEEARLLEKEATRKKPAAAELLDHTALKTIEEGELLHLSSDHR